MEALNKAPYKGGLIKSSYDDCWLYESNGKLTQFEDQRMDMTGLFFLDVVVVLFARSYLGCLFALLLIGMMYWWDGKILTPSTEHNFGSGEFEGTFVKWTGFTTFNNNNNSMKRVVYRWRELDQAFNYAFSDSNNNNPNAKRGNSFNSLDVHNNATWRWRENRLVCGGNEWEAIGDVPPCILLFLQLIYEFRTGQHKEGLPNPVGGAPSANNQNSRTSSRSGSSSSGGSNSSADSRRSSVT